MAHPSEVSAYNAMLEEHSELAQLFVNHGESRDAAIEAIRAYAVICGVTASDKRSDASAGKPWDSCVEKGRRLYELTSLTISDSEKNGEVGLMLPRAMLAVKFWYRNCVATNAVESFHAGLREAVSYIMLLSKL